jgi:hypothetical protein
MRSKAGERTSLLLLPLVFLLASCTNTVYVPLQTPPDEVTHLGDHEGIVIGSIVVRVDSPAPTTAGAAELVADEYRFLVRGYEGPGSGTPERYQERDLFVETKSRYEIAVPELRAVTFVAKMDGGQYSLLSWEGLAGWSWRRALERFPQAPPCYRWGGPIHVDFSVSRGEVAYIGRLTLELPGVVGPQSAYWVHVEDSRQSDLASAARMHQHAIRMGVTNRLMTPVGRRSFYTEVDVTACEGGGFR